MKEKPDRKIMSYVWHFYSLDFSVTEEGSDEQKRDHSKNMFLQEKKFLEEFVYLLNGWFLTAHFLTIFSQFSFPTGKSAASGSIKEARMLISTV